MLKVLPAALTALLLIVGCTPQAPRDRGLNSAQASVAWSRHQATIAEIEGFLITGRVASAELDLRADLRWLQQSDRYFELRLAGPFGAGAVELRGDPSQVEVRSGDGVEQTASPEAWIRQRYGWTLPIAGLRYWALGIPDPAAPSQPVLDAQGRLASLVQNGWTLTYSEYKREGEYDLPRKFEADNGRIKLKLLIDRWTTTPTFRAP